MIWTDESTSRAQIFVADMDYLKVRLILGHIDHPDEWLLSATPDLFRGYTSLGWDKDFGEMVAKEYAENKVTHRLAEMLGGMQT